MPRKTRPTRGRARRAGSAAATCRPDRGRSPALASPPLSPPRAKQPRRQPTRLSSSCRRDPESARPVAVGRGPGAHARQRPPPLRASRQPVVQTLPRHLGPASPVVRPELAAALVLPPKAPRLARPERQRLESCRQPSRLTNVTLSTAAFFAGRGPSKLQSPPA